MTGAEGQLATSRRATSRQRGFLKRLCAVRGSPDPTQTSTEGLQESPNDYPEAWRPAVGGFGEVGRPTPSAGVIFGSRSRD